MIYNQDSFYLIDFKCRFLKNYFYYRKLLKTVMKAKLSYYKKATTKIRKVNWKNPVPELGP